MATARARVAWEPHAGSQTLFLQCPVKEVLYHGTRGPGKSNALLMDFGQDVGRGFGQHWRGIVWREEFTNLEDIIAESQIWFPKVFPKARFTGGNKPRWSFPDGERLLFRHARKPSDYRKYHGWQIPWHGWEELTARADLDVYHMLKATCRSSHPGVARRARYRATTNPWGPGHNIVKGYFIDVAPELEIYRPEMMEVSGVKVAPWPRTHIHGHFSENRALMEAQPDYASAIASSAISPEQASAWLAGDWDIVAGGMFDDLWNRDVHTIQPWLNEDGRLNVPASWYLDRSYDWGSSKPFSVGWWAESDGTTAPNGRTYPRGTLFRIAEWYGWNGHPNQGLRMADSEIGRQIIEKEKQLGIHGRVKPGPADSMIFETDNNDVNIAAEMERHGARFVPADKRPGSRKNGWEVMRRKLQASLQTPMEDAGLFAFETCTQFIRTVPVLPRSERDPDDVDTDAEDHVGDEARYRCLHKPARLKISSYRM